MLCNIRQNICAILFEYIVVQKGCAIFCDWKKVQFWQFWQYKIYFTVMHILLNVCEQYWNDLVCRWAAGEAWAATCLLAGTGSSDHVQHCDLASSHACVTPLALSQYLFLATTATLQLTHSQSTPRTCRAAAAAAGAGEALPSSSSSLSKLASELECSSSSSLRTIVAVCTMRWRRGSFPAHTAGYDQDHQVVLSGSWPAQQWLHHWWWSACQWVTVTPVTVIMTHIKWQLGYLPACPLGSVPAGKHQRALQAGYIPRRVPEYRQRRFCVAMAVSPQHGS